MAMGDWSDSENDAIVADYFAMLVMELAGQSFGKAERNQALQGLIDRGRGSIEYKHRNISAILKGLGETWIDGYKPAFNYQQSLEHAGVRWLAAHYDWLMRVPHVGSARQFNDPAPLWIGTPPTMSNAPEPAELEQTMAIAMRYDVAVRDERNRALGRRGEELIVQHERVSLANAGRHDLAERVRWVSEQEGDDAGYDIASYDRDGSERLIEVKTTNGWERTPFHIDQRACRCRRSADGVVSPPAMELAAGFRAPASLNAHVALTPTSFRASFL